MTGMFFVNHSVYAEDVSNRINSATVVTDTSKVPSTSATTFTDTKDPSKNVTVDAVLGKGVAEPTKANYNGAPDSKPDGSDEIHFKKEVDVNYILINAWKTFKTKTVNLGLGKVTTPYDKKGLAADTDGKDYRKSVADNIPVSENLGKEDIKKGIETGKIEVDGKIYAYQYSKVLDGELAIYDKTKFNDIEVPVSPEGMHNNLGEIDYTKLEGRRRVFLVEELSDGHYGKFVLAENGVTSDEDAVTKWKEGQANAKDFTKENVTLQEDDKILVMDRDTYATVESSKERITTKKGKETYSTEQLGTFAFDDTAGSFRAYAHVVSEDSYSYNIYRKPGEDGVFGTPDDIVYNYEKMENEERKAVKSVNIKTENRMTSDPRVVYGTSVFNAAGPMLSGEATPKAKTMLDVLKGYAGGFYHALTFLDERIDEKAKENISEDDRRKTQENKDKIAAARKRLDDYLGSFSEKIKKDNIDVGIIESNDSHNGELIFNQIVYDWSEHAIGNPLKDASYESLYKLTQFLKGILKIPQVIGEFSIEGRGPHGGMDDSINYDKNSKVYSEYKYITTGYTFAPVIDKEEMKVTEDKFKLIEELYSKLKGGTITREELQKLDKEKSSPYWDIKKEGLAKIISRGTDEIIEYKEYNDITDVRLDEKTTQNNEKDVEKFLAKGTVTILPDDRIKVEDVEVKDTPEWSEIKGDYWNGKLTNIQVTRTHVETVDETTYTKKEIITPIRAYKVMSDVRPQVNHYFYLTKEESRRDPEVTKQGSVVIKYVTIDGKQLKSEVDKDKVPLETTTLIERFPYEDEGDYYKLYTFLGKVDERNEVKEIEQNYDTTSKQYPTLVDADTGFTYEYVGLKQGSAAASGKVVEGTTEVVYEYRLSSPAAPIVEIPEYEGGVATMVPPVVDVPEYTGGVVAIDPPVVDVPEYTGGVVAIDPPVVDNPEYTGETVAISPPVVDVPGYTETNVTNTEPTSEPEKAGIKKETPKQKNLTPLRRKKEIPDLEPVSKKVELPSTGTGQEIAIFSAATSSILSGLGLMVPTSKKKEEYMKQ